MTGGVLPVPPPTVKELLFRVFPVSSVYRTVTVSWLTLTDAEIDVPPPPCPSFPVFTVRHSVTGFMTASANLFISRRRQFDCAIDAQLHSLCDTGRLGYRGTAEGGGGGHRRTPRGVLCGLCPVGG